MVLSHGAHKAERVTITLVPTADESSFRNIPSTFNTLHRSYEWRKSADLNYMLVPRKIASNEILVDLFLNPAKKGKNLLKSVEAFVQQKIHSEWRGLKLGRIGRLTEAVPPRQAFVRGTIEEILGANLDL